MSVNFIISRNEAKDLGLLHYFTGKPCKRNHIAKRYCRNCECCECAKLSVNSYYKKNSKERNYYKDNKERLKEQYKKYVLINKDHIDEMNKIWKKNNPDKVKLSRKKTKQNNKGVVNYHNQLRRIKKLQATPQWINLEDIKQIYKNCPDNFHIDHIIPLQGKLICGLHFADNLQYLSEKENTSKGNKFTPYIEKDGNIEYLR